jgi:hypothetical protein
VEILKIQQTREHGKKGNCILGGFRRALFQRGIFRQTPPNKKLMKPETAEMIRGRKLRILRLEPQIRTNRHEPWAVFVLFHAILWSFYLVFNSRGDYKRPRAADHSRGYYSLISPRAKKASGSSNPWYPPAMLKLSGQVMSRFRGLKPTAKINHRYAMGNLITIPFY